MMNPYLCSIEEMIRCFDPTTDLEKAMFEKLEERLILVNDTDSTELDDAGDEIESLERRVAKQSQIIDALGESLLHFKEKYGIKA